MIQFGELVALGLSVMLFASSGGQQTKHDNPDRSKNALVGTWKLVSVTGTDGKGEAKATAGVHPAGYLTYTADGRMTAIITYEGRKPLSVNDHAAAPAEERAEAFATMVAYAGRYSYAAGKVTHHVEAASVQNWVNADLVREVKFEGNRLILRTPPMLVGGASVVTELVCERLK